MNVCPHCGCQFFPKPHNAHKQVICGRYKCILAAAKLRWVTGPERPPEDTMARRYKLRQAARAACV